MRNHTGNLHKEAKALPSSKASHNRVRLRSTLEQRGSFLVITAFGKRSQTSPHNRLFQPNMALALNPSWKFLMARSHRPLLISTFTQRRCCDMNACERRNWPIWDEKQLLRISMRPPFLETIFRASSSEVAPPTSISVQDGSVKIAREHSGRPASSPDEL